MVDTSTILTSIFIPLFIGPVTIFLKDLWDRYKLHNVEIKKNYYQENIKIVKDKLSLFYWPIYIKLCCLYHLNYNIIEDTDKAIPKIETQEINLSETQSDTPNEEEMELRERIRKKYKKKKCGYEYFNEDGVSIICDNLVNHHDTSKFCLECRKRILENKKPKKKRNKRKKEHITINISDDLEWERNTSDSEYSSPDEQFMEIMKILDKKSDSSLSDITGDGVGIVKDLPQKEVILDRIMIEKLDNKIIEICKDIKQIILNNIAIGQPKSKLGRELTKFIRYCEMEIVVYEANKKKKNQKFYDSKNLGVVNNIRKLLEIIEIDLFVLQKEYNKMIKNYY